MTVSFTFRCNLGLCELDRLFSLTTLDKFDQLLLLQVEEEIRVVVEDLGVQVVDLLDGFFDQALLD